MGLRGKVLEDSCETARCLLIVLLVRVCTNVRISVWFSIRLPLDPSRTGCEHDFGGSPESGWVPAWPPGRRARAGPSTGSAGSAGAGPAAADWSRWFGASVFFSLCHSDAGPCSRSPLTSRDLAHRAENNNNKNIDEIRRLLTDLTSI